VSPPTLDIRNDTGEATIEMNRAAGSPGVSGSGPLMQFSFIAVGKGSTTITLSDLNLKNTQKQPLTVPAPSATVTVQ